MAKALLAKVGIVAKTNCTCNRPAILMDVKGAGWGEAKVPTIVGWLKEETDRRKTEHANAAVAHAANPENVATPEALSVWLRLPFSESAARLLVRRPIRNARAAK